MRKIAKMHPVQLAAAIFSRSALSNNPHQHHQRMVPEQTENEILPRSLLLQKLTSELVENGFAVPGMEKFPTLKEQGS
ncbi:hypothetical protein GX51_06056 [Blastomyces parvus]|uniref:Uncharacterized protein n=1 Tax=Blastomyces parvus TaxID=2060905 RepID=A0A2B7WU07_9EURO|nr:hypothetical protein GX51_06056 [Blastomyces parvus]